MSESSTSSNGSGGIKDDNEELATSLPSPPVTMTTTLNNLNEETKEMSYANPTRVQSRPKKIRFNLDANVLFEDDNEYRQYGEFLIENNYATASNGSSGVNYRRLNSSEARPTQETPTSRGHVRSEPLPQSNAQTRHHQPRTSNPSGPSIPTAASSSIHLLRKRLNPRHSKTIDRLANLFHQVK